MNQKIKNFIKDLSLIATDDLTRLCIYGIEALYNLDSTKGEEEFSKFIKKHANEIRNRDESIFKINNPLFSCIFNMWSSVNQVNKGKIWDWLNSFLQQIEKQ